MILKKLSKTRAIAVITTVLTVTLGALTPSMAQAAVIDIVMGSLTVTQPGTATPVVVSANSATPAMTFTASGVGLSGRGSTFKLPDRIIMLPSSIQNYYPVNGWTTKASCPVEPANFWDVVPAPIEDCGISAVYIDGEPVLNVKAFTTTNAFSPNAITIISSDNNPLFSTTDSAGEVRVELKAGAWNLASGANADTGWRLHVMSPQAVQGYAILATKSVTFKPNGGSGYAYSQSVTTGGSAALTSNTFTRTGYAFAGWNTELDGTGTPYSNREDFSFDNSLTLFATWVVDESGGSGSDASESLTNDRTLAATGSNTSALLGYTLAFTLISFLFGGMLLGSRVASQRSHANTKRIG